MNAVWNVPYVRRPNFVLRYARALGVLVLLALSTIGSTVLTGFATLAAHGWPATTILIVGSTVLNFIADHGRLQGHDRDPSPLCERSLSAPPWRRLFWQTLQLIGSWYVGPQTCQHNSDTYGFFAVVIVLLSWIYLGAQLFLLAAEINVVQPLPAVAPLDRATAVDRRGPTGIRAADEYGRPAARGRVVHPVHRRGRPGPAQTDERGIEAGRSAWKPNELTPPG